MAHSMGSGLDDLTAALLAHRLVRMKVVRTVLQRAHPRAVHLARRWGDMTAGQTVLEMVLPTVPPLAVQTGLQMALPPAVHLADLKVVETVRRWGRMRALLMVL